MKRVFAKRNTRAFLLWFLCFLLAAGGVVTATQAQAIWAERQAYTASLTADTQQLVDYFGLTFRSSVDSCNSIFLSRWYKHYRNIANIYADEFNGLRRMEIQDELRFRLTAMAFCSDLLVVTPPPLDTIITPNGWFSSADYAKIYGNISIAYADGYTQPPSVSALDEGLCVITLQDSTPRHLQGVICLLVDKKSFAGMFSRMLPDHARHVEVYLEGQLLYASGEAGEGAVINTAAVSNPSFSLTLASQSYEQAVLPGRLAQYAMMMVIVLFVSCLLSALLTWLTMKPLRSLLEKYGVNSREMEDPYLFIEGYIEAFSAANTRLRMEKETADRSMAQFLSLMRDEILFGLVTNPHIDYENAHVRSCVPWIAQGHPFLLVLLKQRRPDATAALTEAPYGELVSRALHACLFPVFYGDLCMILWYPDAQAAARERDTLSKTLQALSGDSCHFAFSDVLTSPDALYEGYVALEETLAKQREDVQPSLAAQIRLINLLHNGKAEDCEDCIRQLQKEEDASPDALLRFLLGIALEYQVDAQRFAQAYQQAARGGDTQARWGTLGGLARTLCGAVSSLRDEGMNNTAEAIRQYIDAHFQEPSLCMQTLSDAFSMHRSLISRLLKSHLGVTFSEYLQTLRINRAIDMMRDAQMSISAIAEAVGYANYMTFKRAFTRHHGVTPSAYRDDNLTGPQTLTPR